MENQELNSFVENLGNKKKIIEFKIGKRISSKCFSSVLKEEVITNIFHKFKNYNVKYFNNKVYYYNNLQLIVYNNGSKKCYVDKINMDKLDYTTNNMDMFIVSKERSKIDDNQFPCKKIYDLVFERELISISLKNNLKINIYNKINTNQNNYEVSIQYLYNPMKKENTKEIFGLILSLFQEINSIPYFS